MKEERPYLHAVGHCYRCHAEIEPWIAGLQWFVKVSELTGPAKEATLDGRVTFSPERWQRPYVAWLDNLRDWNISRQLWWGHRIPAWYCPDGHVTVALEDPVACAECGSGDISRDEDVLDTWFSSQLWPFSTLGWPDDTPDLRVFYPNAALVTGYEILYLWVARMIMSGLFLMGDVPFRQVVIHGLVRDQQGRKMSKSLGNVIDPIEMIDRYGADALRFSLARAATGGQQDIPLSDEAIEGGRNFANKIWNAARLVLRAFPGGAPELPPMERLTLAERWLLSRHQACVTEVDAALDAYRFADAAQALHRFLWSELCDWGLELEKGRLEGSAQEAADATQVLAWVLERTLRLLHPTMPFITEEIWQRLAIPEPEAIAIASWPAPHPDHADPEAETALGLVQEIITAIRQFRSKHGISPKVRFDVVAGVPAAAMDTVASRGGHRGAPGRRDADRGGRGAGQAGRVDHGGALAGVGGAARGHVRRGGRTRPPAQAARGARGQPEALRRQARERGLHREGGPGDRRPGAGEARPSPHAARRDRRPTRRAGLTRCR